jgi:hypothetical protein|nr:MAG: Protein of unknown function (DUF1642) [Bacteriophage sp.]DAV54496.1 MAG TPA: Protein of unknown function (DUF1642) [Caudoviricetes sp.]
MTRQEAIEKLSTIGHISVSYAEDLYDSFFKKPVVPQYVADWYEGHKDEFEINLYREVCRSEENYERGGLTDFQKWLISGKVSPFSVLVNMHQFGYEVDKEAKYTVKIKGRLGQYLGKYYLNNEELTPQFTRTQYSEGGSFTRTELEANGFGWVFSCEGVEVKEVE